MGFIGDAACRVSICTAEIVLATDPLHDTVPTAAAAKGQASSPVGRFFRSAPGAFLSLAVVIGLVLALAVLGGYRAGVVERGRAASTAQFAELKQQYDWGIEDMAAGRYALAAQRFEYILAVAPNFSGAAARLAESRAAMATPAATATSAPTLTPDPVSAKRLFAEAQTAFAADDWEATIKKIMALRVADPSYELGAVNKMLFTSYRNRGIASIDAGKLELGLADLDQAESIGALDEKAQQYSRWASLYITGSAYWGLNWPRTIETFSVLYTIAPYFRDTIQRLHDAHVRYGDALDAGGDPCAAALEYAAALEIMKEEQTESRLQAAETVCAQGTPTPDASAMTGTPSPTATAAP